MNTRQYKIFLIAAAVFVLIGLFPPWSYTFSRPSMHARIKPAGYHFITAPPQPEDRNYFHGVELDVTRLLVQWACVLMAGAAGIALLHKAERQS